MIPTLTLGGEQDIPPSRRVWTRIVRIEATWALELRDPNSGVGSDPADKPRHQFVWAGGQLWTRRLPLAPLDPAPGDDSHDAWQDIGVPRWEPCDRSWQPRSVVDEYAEQMADAPAQPGVAFLHRLPLHTAGGRCDYRVGGGYATATDHTDVAIPMGPITGAWHAVALPPCPDCGGALQWAEAGWVPGARECAACGSLFAVEA